MTVLLKSATSPSTTTPSRWRKRHGGCGSPQSARQQRSFDLDLDPAAQLISPLTRSAMRSIISTCPTARPTEHLARSAVEPRRRPLQRPWTGEWDQLRNDRPGEFRLPAHHGFAVETPAWAFVASEIDRLKALDPLRAVRELSRIIYESFDYEAGVTHADSPIDHALETRRGVCQDFSHIMLAICRSWGVPARYVSGYLFTDRKAGDRSDPDATHAWVEVFLPSTRWIGLDPTNNVIAGERHIAAALGRDYNDVPPSRGVYKGEAESQLAVGVSVRRARAAITEPEFIRAAQPAFAHGGRRRGAAGGLTYDQQQQQQQ